LGKGIFRVVEVKFYDNINNELLKVAIIIARTDGKWVFCKHRERDTFELPGGHRECGEDILQTARRELREETGAVVFDIKPICVYSLKGRISESKNIVDEAFGMLFIADIFSFGDLHSEIEKIVITDTLIDNWTYPIVHPALMEEAQKRGFISI